jgi:hypothetical protein
MAGGPLAKRVVCPLCKAPEGMSCRNPLTFKNVKAHPARQFAAEEWYDRKSPDGLTPRRRDAMVEALHSVLRGRAEVGQAMQKITTSEDPEAEFARLTG